MRAWLVPFAATVSLLACVEEPMTAQADPLAAHRWKDRLVVVIAPNGDDARLAEQRAILAAARDGVKERDIVVLEAVGDGADAAALRGKFGDGEAAFRAILVGKDGGAKLASERPLSAERLFRETDAMPMRQQEMRER